MKIRFQFSLIGVLGCVPTLHLPIAHHLATNSFALFFQHHLPSEIPMMTQYGG
jgi:hypothetical protein